MCLDSLTGDKPVTAGYVVVLKCNDGRYGSRYFVGKYYEQGIWYDSDGIHDETFDGFGYEPGFHVWHDLAVARAYCGIHTVVVKVEIKRPIVVGVQRFIDRQGLNRYGLVTVAKLRRIVAEIPVEVSSALAANW